MCWSHGVDFQGHRGHKGQFRFLEHNSKCFRATNLKLDTDTCLESGKRPTRFGATGVNFEVSFGVTEGKKVKIAPMGISCPALWCYIGWSLLWNNFVKSTLCDHLHQKVRKVFLERGHWCNCQVKLVLYYIPTANIWIFYFICSGLISHVNWWDLWQNKVFMLLYSAE